MIKVSFRIVEYFGETIDIPCRVYHTFDKTFDSYAKLYAHSSAENQHPFLCLEVVGDIIEYPQGME